MSIRVLLLLFAVSLSSLLPCQPAFAETGVVARVGSIAVTDFELQREIRRKIPMETAFHAGVDPEKIERIRAAALERLIDQARKVRYALDNGLTASGDELDRRMDAFLAKFATPQQMLGALRGEPLEAYRASLYRQMLAEKAEASAVAEKVSVTEEELRTYYEANRGRYFRPLQFKASHILVQVDPAATAEQAAERRSRAEELLARAKSGEDFYNLAYYESDERSRFVGGNLGYFHEGQTVAEFEQALKQLKPGEISELVRTRWGFHIVKLDERNEARQLEFEELREQLRGNLEKERRAALYDAWLDSLRERYPAEVLN